MGSDRGTMAKTPTVLSGSQFGKNDMMSQREQIKKISERQNVNIFEKTSLLKEGKPLAAIGKEMQNKQSI